MKVRTIRWYRTEGEYWSLKYVLEKYQVEWQRHIYSHPWCVYNFTDIGLRTHRRDDFEKYYLTWKAKNED